MWVNIGIDVVHAKKTWKALLTTHVALGKTEVKVMSKASTEIVARAFPVLVATMAPKS